MQHVAVGDTYEVKAPAGVSAMGRRKILDYLYYALLDAGASGANLCCSSCFSNRFNHWSFVKCLAKGGDASGSYGKLARRLSKYCKEEFDCVLNTAQLSFIGNLYDQYSYETELALTIDFVNTFTWQAGEFGDRGSCFWNSRHLACCMLEKHGVLAMRLFRGSNGVGRALVIPPTALQNVLEPQIQPAYMVINGYSALIENGTHDKIETRNFADLLTTDLMC